MITEKKIVNYILHTTYESIPERAIKMAKAIILAVIGSTIAGSTTEEWRKINELVEDWGGKPEATILTTDIKVPVSSATLVNAVAGRVLDFEDAINPGMHAGPVAFTTGLASAELIGGCSGKEFLTSFTTALEFASRMNKINYINNVSTYDGFDMTGICSVFAGAPMAGRILGLNESQMMNCISLAFNRASGSSQSVLEGTNAVSFIAGSSAQSSMISAQLAQKNFNAPSNFLEGPYGYFHLYAKDNYDTKTVCEDFGERFEIYRTYFKQYSSCGLTQTSTQGALDLVKEIGLTPEKVDTITIRVQPFAQSIVGNFDYGDSTRQNAQFSIPYCVSNALVRKGSNFKHFEVSSIIDPRIREIAEKVKVIADPEMMKKEETSMEMEVKTKDGMIYHKIVDTPHGFPEDEMTWEEMVERFGQCLIYKDESWPEHDIQRIASMVERLEELIDIRDLVPVMRVRNWR